MTRDIWRVMRRVSPIVIGDIVLNFFLSLRQRWHVRCPQCGLRCHRHTYREFLLPLGNFASFVPVEDAVNSSYLLPLAGNFSVITERTFYLSYSFLDVAFYSLKYIFTNELFVDYTFSEISRVISLLTGIYQGGSIISSSSKQTDYQIAGKIPQHSK